MFHSHQSFPYQDLLSSLQTSLSSSTEHAYCLLKILEYFASECEDENIVIEESLRESLFDYIDDMSKIVFTQIYNEWSQKLSDDQTVLRVLIANGFYRWIKMKLPSETIVNITQANQALLDMIFGSMDKPDLDDELMESCTDCII